MFWKNKNNLTAEEIRKKENYFGEIILISFPMIILSILVLGVLAYYLQLNMFIGAVAVPVISIIVMLCVVLNLDKDITKYIVSFMKEKSVNINDLILKKYLIYTYFNCELSKKDKEFIKNIEKEIEEIEPTLKYVDSLNNLKQYIKKNKIDINSLTLEINNKIIDNKKCIEELELDLNNNQIENNIFFELLTDNTVISNEINELINSYKIIQENQSKLDINEKTELNKISNAIRKVIVIFYEIKEFHNEEIENNLILLINELQVSINCLNQSIQNTFVKDIKVLSKTLKLEN